MPLKPPKSKPKRPESPRHLKAPTRVWWSGVMAEYELQPHQVRLLTMAAEAWDRSEQARRAIDKHGITFVDKHGQPRARPEVSIERDSRIAFARLLRELCLDVLAPDDNRPPGLGGR